MKGQNAIIGMILGAALLFTIACGGSDDGKGILGGGSGAGTTPISGDKDERAAKTAAQKFYADLMAVLSNSKPSALLLESWQPSCRQAVKPADLDKGLAEFRKANPGITAQKIEGLDFGDKMKYEKTSDGATVTIPGTSDTQIKVSGKWINAHDYFVEKGLEKAGEGTSTEKVMLIAVEGKYFMADCDDLEDLAEFEAPRTPTPRAGTPTPRTGTPTPASRTPIPAVTVRR